MVKGFTGASEIGSMHIWKATINGKRYIQALEDMVQFKHLGFFNLCFELNMGWWDLYIVGFCFYLHFPFQFLNLEMGETISMKEQE